MNKIRKGEVKIYKGKEYIAIPEIEEESCTGCCFYDKGICLINHADDPNCLHSGMIWEQKENSMSDIKEKAIKLAIDAMKPIPIHSSPCYSVSDINSIIYQAHWRIIPIYPYTTFIATTMIKITSIGNQIRG